MTKAFDKKDFSKLKYNVEEIPKGDNILDHFEDLRQLHSFSGMKKKTDKGYDRQKIFRYIVFMYDKNSPFVLRYNSFEKRFEEAISYVGFDKNEDLIKDVFNLHDQSIKQMVVEFCILMSDLKWASLMQNYHTYYEIENATLEYVSDVKDDEKRLAALERKGKLLELSDRIAERVEKYEQEIFMGNDNIISEAKSKRVTPEMMAAQKNKSTDV